MSNSWTETLLRAIGQIGCKHHWVRARWEDGSYGLRCAECCKAHGRTFTALIQQPLPAATPRARRAQKAIDAARQSELRYAREAGR